MKKGDKQFDVGYGQGGGGGAAGAYKGPGGGSGIGGGGGRGDGKDHLRIKLPPRPEKMPKPPPLPRKGADIDEVTFNSMTRYDEARAREAAGKAIRSQPKTYDGNPFLRQPGESRAQPVLRAGVMAGASAAAAGAVGKSHKDRKDTERSIEYRKKPKMADAPPKINLRKAYED